MQKFKVIKTIESGPRMATFILDDEKIEYLQGNFHPYMIRPALNALNFALKFYNISSLRRKKSFSEYINSLTFARSWVLPSQYQVIDE